MKIKIYSVISILMVVIFLLSACSTIGLGADYQATSNALNEFEEELEDFEDELKELEDDIQATQAVLSGDSAEMPVVEDTAEVEDVFDGDISNSLKCKDKLGCVEYAPNDPIRIASALVISGPNAQLGLDSQYGVEIAIDFKGEIFGHTIELQAEDDGCSAEGGQVAGMKIVSDPSIIAVVGTSCSGAAVPMSQIISDAGYVMVSPSNTAPSLTDPDLSWKPSYLRVSHNDRLQGVIMAEFAYYEYGARTAAVIHDGNSYTRDLVLAFTETFEALGGEITTITEFEWGGGTRMLPLYYRPL